MIRRHRLYEKKNDRISYRYDSKTYKEYDKILENFENLIDDIVELEDKLVPTDIPKGWSGITYEQDVLRTLKLGLWELSNKATKLLW